MSNYSENPNMCRVDFFKESGKWYCTEAVSFSGLYGEPLIHEAFKQALDTHLEGRLKGMQAVCLEPYHLHPHPISMIVD